MSHSGSTVYLELTVRIGAFYLQSVLPLFPCPPKARAHEYVLPMSGRTLAVALTGFSIPSSSYPYQLLAFNPDILSSLAFQFHYLSLIVAQKMSAL